MYNFFYFFQVGKRVLSALIRTADTGTDDIETVTDRASYCSRKAVDFSRTYQEMKFGQNAVGERSTEGEAGSS